MATTSPDNIRTPNSGDQYALVQDLGTLADTVQNALIKRANAYTGTVAQRNAFTSQAPVGTIWSDTDGERLVWKKGASDWEPVSPNPKVDQKGEVTISISTANSGTITTPLSPGRFSVAPLVFLTKQGGGLAKYIPYVSEVTTTSLRIGIYSGDGSSASGSIKIAWWAVPRD